MTPRDVDRLVAAAERMGTGLLRMAAAIEQLAEQRPPEPLADVVVAVPGLQTRRR